MGFQTRANLIILDLGDFDIFCGMTWLFPYYNVLNSNAKSMTIEMPGRNKIDRKGLYKPKQATIISFI